MSKAFLHRICEKYPKAKTAEIGVALLWFHGLENANAALTPKQLADQMEQAGYAKPNITMFTQRLTQDKRTTKGTGKTLRLKLTARADLDKKYLELVKSKPIKKSDSIIPLEIIENTRKYIEKVTCQINVSYDQGLYDCTSVMCRRLLETLIIEVYEELGRANELKGKDGNFMMFSGLLNVIEHDKIITLSRNAKSGLRELKKLGDLSAHNRRFNATKSDIDKVSTNLRVSVEELLHLANLS